MHFLPEANQESQEVWAKGLNTLVGKLLPLLKWAEGMAQKT